jgi:hypothetical protein
MIEQQPILTAGPVMTPVLRTGIQGFGMALILQGFVVFDIWHPTPDQTTWLMAAGATAGALGQNLVERWQKRKLIGRPVPPPLPSD